MKGRPKVLSTHGSLLGYKKYLRPGANHVPYKLYDAVTFKCAAKKAEAVIVSSKLEYEDAVEFGIDKKKIHVIPMGVSVAELPDPPQQKEKFPLNILFVGRLARVRRVELLLKAVRKLTFPFQLTIVGGEEKTSSLTRSGYFCELIELCQELGIESKVRFVGKKSPEELHDYYRSADVFVYTSKYENFAQPILEAAAAGLPVISTPVGVAPEIIRDGETGFLVSDSPGEISEGLVKMIDPNTRKNFGTAIRETVQKNFGWDEIMDQYMEVYNSL